MVRAHDGTSLSHKKECSPDMHHNRMDLENHVEQKRPDPKGHTVLRFRLHSVQNRHTETERLMAVGGCGTGSDSSSWGCGDENIPQWTVGTVMQLWEHTEDCLLAPWFCGRMVPCVNYIPIKMLWKKLRSRVISAGSRGQDLRSHFSACHRIEALVTAEKSGSNAGLSSRTPA